MTTQTFDQDPNPPVTDEFIAAADNPGLRLVCDAPPTHVTDQQSELATAAILPMDSEPTIVVRSPQFVAGTAFNHPTGYLDRLIKTTTAKKEAEEAEAHAKREALLAMQHTPAEVRARLAKQAVEAARRSKLGPSGWLRRLGFSH